MAGFGAAVLALIAVMLLAKPFVMFVLFAIANPWVLVLIAVVAFFLPF